MGYTSHEISLITKHLGGVKSVLDFGAQCNYSIPNQAVPPFIDSWYRAKGIQYDCIDLAGDNGSIKYNWSQPIDILRSSHLWEKWDMIVDAGSSEHSCCVDEYKTESFHKGHINSVYPKEQPTLEKIQKGYFHCWQNKHLFLKTGGLMVNINPKTGNWPGHGYSYISKDFYTELAKMADYEILELGEQPASGNDVNGWNVYAVLKKVGERFPAFEDFKQLHISSI